MSGALPYWRGCPASTSSTSLCLGYGAVPGAVLRPSGLFPARIGELIAIPMLMRCLAPNLWGWLGDHTGQRLLIVRFGALCTLVCFAGIFFSQSYAWLALIMATHAFFWHAVLPQFEVITLAHLREQAARYSQIRLWGSIGFIVAVVGLGLLFEWLSLDAYPAALLVIMAGIVASSLWVPNAQPVLRPSTLESDGFLRQLRRPGILAFYACVGLMQLSNGPYYTFLTLHLEGVGYSRGAIGLFWALGVVAEILLFLVMARLLQRYSLRAVLLASFLITAVRWLLLGNLAQYLPVLLLAQCMHAATFGAFHAACIHFVQRSFADRQQGQAQALYVSLAGIGGALGALYAGYSWKSLGPGWTFAIASLVALLAAFIIATRLPPERP
ncbi:MFS transporter [Pseudomonas sp. MDMC_285]|nr:MFS transporter [Pseudomonas sp. MDMC_285]